MSGEVKDEVRKHIHRVGNIYRFLELKKVGGGFEHIHVAQNWRGYLENGGNVSLLLIKT